MAQHRPPKPFEIGKKRVVVIGAGVIGLTTALRLQEKGLYQVEILAEILPTDPKNIKYASHWAGAHHVSTAQRLPDVEYPTFLEMWKLSEPGGEAEHCFMRVPQTEYFDSPHPKPSPLDRMPKIRKIGTSDLPLGAKDGYEMEALTIDIPIYLNYLLSRFLGKGGSVVRGSVQHISQVLEAGSYPFLQDTRNIHPTPPDSVVVCVGLGARTLGGIEDHAMVAARGQTVIIRAPWVKFGRSFHNDTNQEWSYIIPRRSGDVIVGGTVGVDDWYPRPRPETTKEILMRGLRLCPELVPPHLRRSDKLPEVDDVSSIIVEEGCGLRPLRKEGRRIELEYMNTTNGKSIPVIHNYGHGGVGYMSSFGSADVVLRLMEEAFTQ